MRAGLRIDGVFAFMVALAGSGCARHAPPTPERIDATVSPLPPPGAIAASGALPDAAVQAEHAAVAPTTSATAPTVGAGDAGDPGALPQTHDKPAGSGTPFETRARALWDAIARDEPEVALPFFFPVTAYEQVKAISSPASDWRHRLVAAYKRDIHGLHKRLGDKASAAKFIRVDVPDDRARWVEPNEEYNKLGYWRVYGTHIIYELDGKERTLDVSSLISWRGEWYVVHLTGFK